VVSPRSLKRTSSNMSWARLRRVASQRELSKMANIVQYWQSYARASRAQKLWWHALRLVISHRQDDPWAEFELHKLTSELSVQHMYNPRTDQWEKRTIMVKVQEKSFAAGAQREVRWCFVTASLCRFAAVTGGGAPHSFLFVFLFVCSVPCRCGATPPFSLPVHSVLPRPETNLRERSPLLQELPAHHQCSGCRLGRQHRAAHCCQGERGGLATLPFLPAARARALC